MITFVTTGTLKKAKRKNLSTFEQPLLCKTGNENLYDAWTTYDR